MQIRVDIVRKSHSLAELRTVVDRSNVIQEALWQQAKAMIVRTGLFVQTLNEMIDDQEKRLAALRNASGLDPKRNRLPVYIMGVLVSAVILLIFDLDRPSGDFITNDQQSMVDVATSIGAFPD